MSIDSKKSKGDPKNKLKTPFDAEPILRLENSNRTESSNPFSDNFVCTKNQNTKIFSDWPSEDFDTLSDFTMISSYRGQNESLHPVDLNIS